MAETIVDALRINAESLGKARQPLVQQVLIEAADEIERLRSSLDAIAKAIMPPADTRREQRFQNLVYSLRNIAREAIGIEADADVAEIDYESRFRQLEADAETMRGLERLLTTSNVYLSKDSGGEYWIRTDGKTWGVGKPSLASAIAAAVGEINEKG